MDPGKNRFGMDDTTNQTSGLYGDPKPWDASTSYNITPPNSTFVFEFFISPLMDKIMNILTITMLFFSMISLGCTMEIPKIRAHFLRPKGVAIAVVAQYGFMPLSAFLLGKVFWLSPLEALAVLICGCCPGGSLSNIFALTVQGDMNLSQGIPNIERMVPYTGIILALLMTLVPCAIGIAINHRAPRYSPIIIKAGMGVLLVCCVPFAVMAGIIMGDILLRILTPRLLATASLMPLSGFLFGYLLSSIFRLNGKCRRTIGVETGCQNTQICFTILKVAFPLKVIGPLLLFPLLFSVFQTAEALAFAIVFRCYTRFKAPAKDKDVYQTVDLKAEGEGSEAVAIETSQ
ncbi:sodium/bile acid cotransporter-like isoform X3 [Anguilla anguilla]|uniref:sodium/bile acid cotransporter-like isoform X3 n=1 Tax=Anguilla anguilla TaxID=7936 RepID=UPI0015B204A1|nr:sodium/bile acid cotransporter-like isoform X3 [Anguilla anguilla]